MIRFLSFVAAAIALAGAVVEIASFAIDHQSWIRANIAAARDQVVTFARSRPFASADCQQNCAAPEPANSPRCEGVEPLGSRILCYFTIPKAATACNPEPCQPQDKPPLPRDWIRNGPKGDVASGPVVR